MKGRRIFVVTCESGVALTCTELFTERKLQQTVALVNRSRANINHTFVILFLQCVEEKKNKIGSFIFKKCTENQIYNYRFAKSNKIKQNIFKVYLVEVLAQETRLI